MAKAVKLKKLRFTNPYKGFRKRFQRDAKKLPEREAAFIRVRARSIMRKAPKKPKSRFGNLQAYSKRSKKYGKSFWRKGLYSRPGHPPFHNGQAFNLRTIVFNPVSAAAVDVPHARTVGGTAYAWRVGPKYRKNKYQKIPIPQLHEYGGTVRLHRRSGKTFKDRNIKLSRGGKSPGVIYYPERPYMRPSAKEARTSFMARSPNSLKKLVTLGGAKGKRTY